DRLPDGTVLPGGLVRGNQEIASFVRNILDPVLSVHLGSMPEIDLQSSTSATGVWSMYDRLIWPEGSPVRTLDGYGHYREEYEKVAGEWRIKRLKLTRLRVDTT